MSWSFEEAAPLLTHLVFVLQNDLKLVVWSFQASANVKV